MTDQLLARIYDLEGQTEEIRRELADLRELANVLQSHPTPAAAPPEAPPVAPRAWAVAPPPLSPTPAGPSRYGQPAGPALPEFGDAIPRLLRRLGRGFRGDVATLDLLGPKALAWAGGIVTVLGVVFFFVLAVNRGWIGPGMRVTFGALASAAVLGAGLWLRRRYGETYSSLAAAGAGIAGGYATLLAATALYDLVPKPVALVAAGLIASAGVAVSLAWSAQIVAGIGLIGATVVPALVAFDGGLTRIGTAFVAVVLAATGVVGVRMRWRRLLVAGAVASLPQIAVLIADADGYPWAVVVLAAMFWVLYAGVGVAEQLARDAESVDSLPAAFLLGSAGFLVYSAALLFGDRAGGDLQGTAFLVAAVVYAAGAIVIRRELGMLLGALALAAVAVGLAQILSGASLTYAWAAEAAALAWVAQRFARLRFQLAALAYLVLAVGHALLFEASLDHLFEAMRHPAGGAPTIAACAIALLVVAFTVRGLEGARDDELRGLLRPLGNAMRALRGHEPVVRGVAFTVSALLSVYAASLTVLVVYQHSVDGVDHAFDLAHVALTSAWAVLGLVALVVALLRRAEAARVLAVFWLGLVGLKTLGFDAVVLSPTLRSYAFLAVAGALFAATVLLHELDGRINLSPLAAPGLAGTLLFSLSGGTTIASGSTSDGGAVLAVGVALTLIGGLEQRLPCLRNFASILWGVGLAVAAVGEAIMVGGIPLVLIWTGSAVVLALLAGVIAEQRLAFAAGLYLVVAAGYTLVEETPPSRLVHATLHPGLHLAAVALVVAATAAVAQIVRADEEGKRSARATGFWSAGILGVYGLCLGILELVERIAPGHDVQTNFQRGHTAVSGFLGLLGLGLLYAGLKRSSRGLRAGGLALLAVILVKIFLYDLAALSSATRAVSFLAVGGALLLGGFFYQRLASDA
jgi:hypothetical protein